MHNDHVEAAADDARTILLNEISWGAVLAGVVVALVTQLILNMLGVGIGAATLDPMTGDSPSASSFSIGAGIWWALSGIVASLAGGYAAGRLAARPKLTTAGWHGLTTWAATTLIVFYLLTSAAGGILGGAYRTISGAVDGAASAVGSTARTAVQAAAPQLAQVTDAFGSIEQSIRGATGSNDPAALRDAAISAARAAITGDQAATGEAKERAAEALSRAQSIPVEQARTQIDAYERDYRAAMTEARQRAAQAAQATAEAVSSAALFGALGLILGAIAAWFGGRLGAVNPISTRLRRGMRQTA